MRHHTTPVPLSSPPADSAPATEASSPAGTMPRQRRLALAATAAGLVVLGLAACGQRGPLYLPDPNDPTKKRS